MGIFSNVELLEIIEAYAADNNGVDSEQSLSDWFDDEIATLVIEKYGADDETAMSETFSDWADSLCKDGELHELQYNEYCYVGDYA